MIPKSSYSNLYLGIYQAEKKEAGQTVRGSGPDCLAVPGGMSAGAARTVRAGRGSSGRYWMLRKLFRTVCAGVSDRPHASRTVHGCVAECPHVLCVGGAKVASG
jgi:hypothetical protein